MNSTPTVLPSRQIFAHDRSDADIGIFYAIELFLLVVVLNAVLLTLAGPTILEVASLTVTVT